MIDLTLLTADAFGDNADRVQQIVAAAAGLPDLVSEDPRFASHATRTENIDAILAMLERVFAERTTAVTPRTSSASARS